MPSLFQKWIKSSKKSSKAPPPPPEISSVSARSSTELSQTVPENRSSEGSITDNIASRVTSPKVSDPLSVSGLNDTFRETDASVVFYPMSTLTYTVQRICYDENGHVASNLLLETDQLSSTETVSGASAKRRYAPDMFSGVHRAGGSYPALEARECTYNCNDKNVDLEPYSALHRWKNYAESPGSFRSATNVPPNLEFDRTYPHYSTRGEMVPRDELCVYQSRRNRDPSEPWWSSRPSDPRFPSREQTYNMCHCQAFDDVLCECCGLPKDLSRNRTRKAAWGSKSSRFSQHRSQRGIRERNNALVCP